MRNSTVKRPADDYETTFRDPAWVNHVNAHSALDYFKHPANPFYDRQCNNELVAMQRMGVEQLLSMQGVEYSLVPSEDEKQLTYAVRKQNRRSKSHADNLALYYIVAGTIYQAPNLHRLFSSRVSNVAFCVNNAFKKLEKGVHYTPTQGYSWDFSQNGKVKSSVKADISTNLVSSATYSSGYLNGSMLPPVDSALFHHANSSAKSRHLYMRRQEHYRTRLNDNRKKVDSILKGLLVKYPVTSEPQQSNETKLVKRQAEELGSEHPKKQKA